MTGFKNVVGGIAVVLCSSAPAWSEDNHIITTAWSQLVVLDVPERFLPVHDQVAGNQFIMELTPKGQTVHKWSEMITLFAKKGGKGGAKSFAQDMVQAYGKGCADTYTVVNLPPPKIKGAKAAAAAYVGCGDLGGYSEAMVFVAIDGAQDLYSLQWAVRGKAIAEPPAFDEAKWMSRLSQFKKASFCKPSGKETPDMEDCVN